ncbi:hypothetical protein PV04_09823 [Phialophora macrospora]|uniref:Transcription factor domain-containing protein n=1 Tax=Phialophora macrospora TaxID=1851006 RepID=A0A0D2CCZ7_9EURO|nr:hypothetical protein PV04_09823 [Phialophora macrospora]
MLWSSFCQNSNISNPLRDDGFSREWAEQASRLVFKEAEHPDEDKIVSFTILCLFWYSHGNWQRAAVHEGNAVIQWRLTSFSEMRDSSEPSFQNEMRCRRFWGAYLINIFVSEPTTSFSWPVISTVWLPCQEEDFENGMVSSCRVKIPEQLRPPSIFAEIVRITTLWSSIYKFIREADRDPGARLSALNVLDAQLREWRAHLPPCFSLEESASPPPNDDRLRLAILILHVIYHQCMCVLHASIVPLFSLGPARRFLPYVHGQRLSAQVAYQRACKISRIVQNTLSCHPDDAFRWSGFVGYALYCSCAVQLPFLWNVDSGIAENARNNIKANLETMAKIGRNWRYILNLGVHVRKLYQYHSTEPIALPVHIQDFSATDLSGHGQTQRNPRPILDKHEMIWDYERTLARRAPLDPDQEQPDGHLEKCKELVEQVPSPETSSTVVRTRTDLVGSTLPAGQYNRNASNEHVQGAGFHGAEELFHAPEGHMHPSISYAVLSPTPTFDDMNAFEVSEHDQMLFLQAMNDAQAENLAGTMNAFENWLS